MFYYLVGNAWIYRKTTLKGKFEILSFKLYLPLEQNLLYLCIMLKFINEKQIFVYCMSLSAIGICSSIAYCNNAWLPFLYGIKMHSYSVKMQNILSTSSNTGRILIQAPLRVQGSPQGAWRIRPWLKPSGPWMPSYCLQKTIG